MIKTIQVLCGRCRVPLEGPAEPTPDDRYACPVCGEGDRFEVVMSEVTQSVAEVTKPTVGEEGALNGNSAALPNSRWRRFIADVES